MQKSKVQNPKIRTCRKFFISNLHHRHMGEPTMDMHHKNAGRGTCGMSMRIPSGKNKNESKNKNKADHIPSRPTSHSDGTAKPLASYLGWTPKKKNKRSKKNNTKDSNVVPHRSTNLARSCLTSLSRREAVLS